MSAGGVNTQPVIGIDLGGTNMQVGFVSPDNVITARVMARTNADHGKDHVIRRIVELVREVCSESGTQLSEVPAIGIAAPGAIEIPTGVVLDAFNLRWTDVPLRDILQDELKCRVVVDNDVNAAVFGEYKLGAGRESRNILGVWVGTGVGGGLILDGQLYHGSLHTAGEIGRTVLFPNGEPDRRAMEDFCSRTGMWRMIRERVSDYPKSPLSQSTDGVDETNVLARAFLSGDELAVEVVNDSARLLGIAIANCVSMFSVDTVIVGGGMAEVLGETYLEVIKTSCHENVFPSHLRICRIVKTQLESDAGILGAALLARELV